jgi:hypothetical protein
VGPSPLLGQTYCQALKAFNSFSRCHTSMMTPGLPLALLNRKEETNESASGGTCIVIGDEVRGISSRALRRWLRWGCCAFRLTASLP